MRQSENTDSRHKLTNRAGSVHVVLKSEGGDPGCHALNEFLQNMEEE